METNPVMFMKILPQVEFNFNFKLFDSKVLSKLIAEKKKQLFKHILLDIGIGAKTNVGYGQFDISEEEKEKIKKKKAERERIQLEKERQEKEDSKTEAEKRIVKGEKIECRVFAISKKEVGFKFDWDDEITFSKKKSKLNIELQVGDILEIEIIDDFYICNKVLFSNNVIKK